MYQRVMQNPQMRQMMLQMMQNPQMMQQIMQSMPGAVPGNPDMAQLVSNREYITSLIFVIF